MLAHTCVGGRLLVLFPPGIAAGTCAIAQEPDRWRVAVWFDVGEPDWGSPADVRSVTTGAVLAELGPRRTDWIVEAVTAHAERLAASTRDPFTGRLIEARVTTARGAIALLNEEAAHLLGRPLAEIPAAEAETPGAPIGSLVSPIDWDRELAEAVREDARRSRNTSGPPRR